MKKDIETPVEPEAANNAATEEADSSSGEVADPAEEADAASGEVADPAEKADARPEEKQEKKDAEEK